MNSTRRTPSSFSHTILPTVTRRSRQRGWLLEIGFAHTFAAEGEHDQAISAYSTAARLFQGTHLPQLFLGMQNLQLNNIPLAHEYLNTAYTLCQRDPLLLNELGVVFYHEENMAQAIRIFRVALAMAALRRIGNYDEALAEFDEVLRRGGKDAGIFCARGLLLLEMGESWQAALALHEALAVSPQDPVATELLSKALEANETMPLMEESEEDEFERRIDGNRRDAEREKQLKAKRVGKRRVNSKGGDAFEGESMEVDTESD